MKWRQPHRAGAISFTEEPDGVRQRIYSQIHSKKHTKKLMEAGCTINPILCFNGGRSQSKLTESYYIDGNEGIIF